MWRSRTLGSFCILAFLIGLFLGGLIVFIVKPNTITFEIRNNTKMFLVPRKGDIVNWITETPGKTPNITFDDHPGQVVPCVEGFRGLPSCTVAVNSGPYNYHCDTPNTCFDPGWDPGSTSNPSRGGGGGGGDIIKFIHMWKIKILQSFQKKNIPQTSAMTLPPTPGDGPPTPDVHCGADGSATADPAVSRSGWQTEWQSSTLGTNWSVTPAINPAPGMCTETGQMTVGKVCTAPTVQTSKNFSYTVFSSACPVHSGTAVMTIRP